MTILNQAIQQVEGFDIFYHKVKRKMTIDDKSISTINNYSRYLARLALYFKQVPTEISLDKIEQYLYEQLQVNPEGSRQYFKFTIYSLRYACKVMGTNSLKVALPSVHQYRKLPVVLSKDEVIMLLNRPYKLKHRVLLALLYGCGLRLSEVRNLKIEDIDLDREVLCVRKSKGRKDRVIPMGKKLTDILKTYFLLQKPDKWLFNGYRGKNRSQFLIEVDQQYGKPSLQWAVKRAAYLAGIRKQMNVHTLRHTYATHLLENGVNILSIMQLLGHSDIKTTMVYLHVAKIEHVQQPSPLDSLPNVDVIQQRQFSFNF